MACLRAGEIAAGTLDPAGGAAPADDRVPAARATAGEVVLRVEDLVKTFPVTRGAVLKRRTGTLHAVNGVGFELRVGETLGLVGESGSGKTTTLMEILRMRRPEGGRIEIAGTDVATLAPGSAPARCDRTSRSSCRTRSAPWTRACRSSSCSPNRCGPLGRDRASIRARVRELLALVGLDDTAGARFPAALSGGQRQRVGIARALATEPKLLALDEPLSALDVSVQAGVINLLARLKAELGLAYLVVAHDLAVIRYVCDRIAVMYLGHIVETGETEAVFADPRHPYTRALLSAVPVPDPARERTRERIVLEGEQPGAARLPAGCVFADRCPLYRSAGDTVRRLLPHRAPRARPRARPPRPPVRLPRGLTGPVLRTAGPPHSPPTQKEPSAMRARLALPAALLTAISVTATACQSSSGTGATGSDAKDTPAAASGAADYNPTPYDRIEDGGTYTSAGTFDDQGNPFNVNATLTASRVWSWYNADAITYSPTGDVQYNPDYFSDVKVSVEGGDQTVTLTINPKAVFNDGTPIDWTAIRATWQANNGSDKAYAANSTDGYDRITSVEKGKDAKQAVLTFKGVYPAWSSLFTTFLHPKAATVGNFDKAYVKKAHPEWGAGPYTVGSWDTHSGNLTFVRNPRWWGRKGKLDKRVYVNLESTAAVNAFKNGQLDSVPAVDAESLQQVKGVKGTEIRRGGSPFEYSLYLNTKSPVLADKTVRKAVEESVDRAQIAKIQFQGLDYQEPLPGSAVLYSFQKGYQDNVSAVLAYAPDAARKELDAAGWKPGSDGIRARNGRKLEIGYTLLGDDPLGKATAGALAAMLKQAEHPARHRQGRRGRLRRHPQRAQVRPVPLRQPLHGPVRRPLPVRLLLLGPRLQHHRRRHARAGQGDPRDRPHRRPRPADHGGRQGRARGPAAVRLPPAVQRPLDLRRQEGPRQRRRDHLLQPASGDGGLGEVTSGARSSVGRM
ncbi:oligopeptide/dipeptide ABC transporter ATP-binding protein [Streptomyces lasalocidi]